MFLATAVNNGSTPQKQNGFRYTLTSTSTSTPIISFANREPIGSLNNLVITGTVFIGGDIFYPNNGVNYWMQGVRSYVNYFPNSEDDMINLAIMETGNTFHYSDRTLIFLSGFIGTLYIVHFSSLPSMKYNQTVFVNYYQETSQGTLAYKGKEIKLFQLCYAKILFLKGFLLLIPQVILFLV